MKRHRTAMWHKYDKEPSHRLFTPYVPWTTPKNWYKNIRWFFKSFKYAHQRIRRGYSDYDLWDIGDYLTGLAAQSLEDFMHMVQSYPINYEQYNLSEDSDEGWGRWKDEISACSARFFLSLECLEDFNYHIPDMPGAIEFIDSQVKHTGATEEQVRAWHDECMKIIENRQEACREAMEWLTKHIMELWN